MSHNQFEIPQELRQLAEENVERARQLYLQFMAGVERTMSAWSAPSSDLMTPGFDQVRERATKLTKENADAAFKLAKEVANAKDFQELLSLQSRYVQSQMRWYADQTQEFGKLMAKALTSVQQQPRPREAAARSPSSWLTLKSAQKFNFCHRAFPPQGDGTHNNSPIRLVSKQIDSHLAVKDRLVFSQLCTDRFEAQAGGPGDAIISGPSVARGMWATTLRRSTLSQARSSASAGLARVATKAG